ncbi:MAG: hypothetical protein K8R63_06270 [Bacteroidales bacterium]|nr:hypothetical protein [Bacteroidales bacterium]
MQNIVPVNFLPATPFVFLRELCGKDEMSVSGTRSLDAIRLLDSITNGNNFPHNDEFKAEDLTIADRDRMLCAIYQNTYGNNIISTVDCAKCEKQYDMDFALDSLIKSLEPVSSPEFSIRDSVYVFSVNGGMEFRLPNGVDEIALLGMDQEQAQKELLSRCVLNEEQIHSMEKVEQAMEKIAPLIDHIFNAKCPECEHEQEFHFNIQHYLLSSLMQEKKQLAFEVHSLATAYNWGLKEILELPRTQRRMYMKILDSG